MLWPRHSQTGVVREFNWELVKVEILSLKSRHSGSPGLGALAPNDTAPETSCNSHRLVPREGKNPELMKSLALCTWT